MCSLIKNLLSDHLSPDQISGRLKLDLGIEISLETICRYIWGDSKEAEIYTSI